MNRDTVLIIVSFILLLIPAIISYFFGIAFAEPSLADFLFMFIIEYVAIALFCTIFLIVWIFILGILASIFE